MRRLSVLMVLFIATSAVAQHSHGPATGAPDQPQETGQSAFAAMAETVAILRADPGTNWKTVDIDGLRRHLIDMDLLSTEAVVTRTPRSRGARFEIRGRPRVREAIRAMVPAHAPFLAAETGWNVTTEILENGVALTVDGDASQIRGLGFFGLMTIGAHHRDHHLLMARGAAPVH